MTAKIVNFEDCTRGDTINARKYTATDENGDPIDLTGAVIRCHFKTDGAVAVEKSIGDGFTVADPTTGIFIMDKFKLETAGLWEYDIEITYANTDVKTYIQGVIRIKQDITV